MNKLRVPTAAPEPLAGSPALRTATRNVLLRFRHGLGDAVQFTIVLKHLRPYRPDWNVDVAALVGKHSAYHGLCRQMLILDHQNGPPSGYDEVFSLDWHECRTAFANCPSTKPARCLSEVFGVVPSQDLFQYEIRYGDRARALAQTYLAGVCPSGPDADGRFPAVLIHYQGNTSGDRKDLPHELVRDVCEVILHCGAVPVILDWDRRSPPVDGRTIHNPGAEHELWHGTGTGDAESLAALIDASRLLIGVDSGPLHVAGATSTPTIGVWTQHHPVHYFDLANNVFHLVPGDHEKHAAGPQALEYFRAAYHWRTYKQLYVDLPALVHSRLTGEEFENVANKRFLRTLTARGFDRRYYEEHQLAGLDYLGFGDWQRQYGRWLVDSLELKGKRVLDVGCACGAILRGLGEAGAVVHGLGEAGAVVHGVDLNEYTIQLGREKWPDMAPLLFTCDAVNLHLYPDESWDAVHTAQVAEHWKPDLVPHILREFWRVVVAGGLLFCALDTEELLTRQGRNMDREDPTHHCIRPLDWWHEQLAEAGWEVCSSTFEPALRQHPESFLKRYDWDWFVARKRDSQNGTGSAQDDRCLSRFSDP